MNREDFNQNFILLNIGYAYHDADWNWKNVKSPFSRIHIVIKGNAKIIRDDRTVYTKENHMYLTPSHINHSYKGDGIYEQYYIHIVVYNCANCWIENLIYAFDTLII